MIKRVLAPVMLITVAAAARGDYIERRWAAMELVRTGKFREALTAFMKAAEDARFPEQEADALKQAAFCARSLKDHETALDLAGKIPLEPVSKTLQMQLLSEMREHRELVGQFENIDMTQWPEKEAGEAFFYRGTAYYSLRRGERAAADLQAAIRDLANGYLRARAVLVLGQTYQTQLKNPEKALEFFRMALAMERKRDPWGWVYFTSVSAAAAILADESEFDEAIELLHQVEIDKLGNSYWRVRMLSDLGDIYRAQGNTREAIAAYVTVVDTESADESIRAACRKKLEALQRGRQRIQ